MTNIVRITDLATASALTGAEAIACVQNNNARKVTVQQIINQVSGDFVTLDGIQTLTNKTITSPDINGGTLDGVTIGATVAPTVTNLGSVATCDINGGTLDGVTIGATTPAAGTFSSLSDSGNLTFTGTGNRITGDFSNTTRSSRVMFQTSTTNGMTSVGICANGTNSIGQLNLYGGSDPNNAQCGQVIMLGGSSGDFRIGSTYIGTPSSGTFLPITFYTGGTERMRIDSSGNVSVASGNLAFSTSGKGIDFSATANSSGTMTSELLSDYEEGTWGSNSILTGTGSNPTGTFSGSYTKVGRLVTCRGIYSFTAAGSGYYQIAQSTLPFAASGSVVRMHGTASFLDTGTALYTGFSLSDGTTISFVISGAAFSATVPFTVVSGDNFTFEFTYEA